MWLMSKISSRTNQRNKPMRNETTGQNDPSHSTALVPHRLLDDGRQSPALDEYTGSATEPGSSLWLRILIAMAVLYGVFSLGVWAANRSAKPPSTGPFAATETGKSSPLLVHVAGRVRRPGVYNLPPGSRVRDAIQKAGGPLQDSDINSINLAAWAEDGTRIEVLQRPKSRPGAVAPPPVDTRAVVAAVKSEVSTEISDVVAAEMKKAIARARAEARTLSTASAAERRAASKADSGEARKGSRDKARTAANGSAPRPVKAAKEYLAKHPINLNTATDEQLQTLPGVGPALAARIMAYRAEAKGFKTIDDLDNVQGIGEKKLEKLRPLVAVK
jgi:competence protein ComEA